MSHKPNERCPKCNGYGVKWNDNFEASVDRICDTQGLSFYDAIQRTKKNPRFRSDFWDCSECKGTGKIS
ncbi:hypothetical protein RZN22_13400 [Bacillaceae bacterium S4-13-58]